MQKGKLVTALREGDYAESEHQAESCLTKAFEADESQTDFLVVVIAEAWIPHEVEDLTQKDNYRIFVDLVLPAFRLKNETPC